MCFFRNARQSFRGGPSCKKDYMTNPVAFSRSDQRFKPSENVRRAALKLPWISQTGVLLLHGCCKVVARKEAGAAALIFRAHQNADRKRLPKHTRQGFTQHDSWRTPLANTREQRRSRISQGRYRVLVATDNGFPRNPWQDIAHRHQL